MTPASYRGRKNSVLVQVRVKVRKDQGKIQSENSLAGFPEWLFPLQCQKNDKFTLTHSHTQKRNPRKVKKRTMESPYFFQSINFAWMTAKTCNFIGFPKSISSPRSGIL